MTGRPSVPTIDISPLVTGDGDRVAVAREIDSACRRFGFFSVLGHGVDPRGVTLLDGLARDFFALPEAEKAEVAMPKGGQAWRGWFPLHGELTSGVADQKEGFYFGEELGPDDGRVRRNLPMHGANLFPARPAGLRAAVLGHMEAMTALGHTLVGGLGLGLGLGDDWFHRHLTARPTILFRIFRYPPEPPAPTGDLGWGVAEHTDYGLLTILGQDGHGGLQVGTPEGWVDVPAEPGAFVCNLGDMLERMTSGAYRSTPHRVRNLSGAERLSFPFFFDPGWDAEVRPALAGEGTAVPRWDGEDVHGLDGTYGDYLSAKVSKVFPDLDANLR